MDSLSNELKGVIERRLQIAAPREILSIASALCASEIQSQTKPLPMIEPRFEIIQGRESNLVRDTGTGLIWAQGNLPGGRMNWSDAQAACAKLDLGGYRDWRLPTIKELLTLVDYDRHDPAIDISVFNCESAWYWTATPAASPSDYAWFVVFSGGFSGWGRQNGECFVRPVRASQ